MSLNLSVLIVLVGVVDVQEEMARNLINVHKSATMLSLHVAWPSCCNLSRKRGVRLISA